MLNFIVNQKRKSYQLIQCHLCNYYSVMLKELEGCQKFSNPTNLSRTLTSKDSVCHIRCRYFSSQQEQQLLRVKAVGLMSFLPVQMLASTPTYKL